MKGTFLFKEGTVFYTQKGKGRAVILLHGFMESQEIWSYYSKMLSPYFRVVAPDLPGHGRTDCYGYVHEMELMADCIRALLRHLKLRKVVLAGHSMGGYAALAFAERYPDMVAGLCLFHSTAAADSPQKKKDRDRAIKVIKKNHIRYIDEAIPRLFFQQYKSYGRQIRRIKNLALKTPLQGILAGLEGMKIRQDRSIVLRFAPYPVLFIVGKEDLLLDHEELVRQSELPALSRLELLEDVGHMGFIEARDKCWIAIKDFVRSPPRSGHFND